MEEDKQNIERQTAKITSISELISGQYVKKEGWEPNFVLTKNNEKISRANIVAIVVTIPDNADSIFVDDGSGKIEIRSFENTELFKDITIGDIILIIGRPRDFNNQIYINGEIINKINNKGWIEFRKKEIMLKNIRAPEIKQNPPQNIETLSQEQEKVEEETKEMDEIEEIMLKIKELDDGHGCDVQELTKQFANAEEIIEQLLMKGEIFENTPGKVKVLE